MSGTHRFLHRLPGSARGCPAAGPIRPSHASPVQRRRDRAGSGGRIRPGPGAGASCGEPGRGLSTCCCRNCSGWRQSMGITGVGRMRKSQLIEAIQSRQGGQAAGPCARATGSAALDHSASGARPREPARLATVSRTPWNQTDLLSRARGRAPRPSLPAGTPRAAPRQAARRQRPASQLTFGPRGQPGTRAPAAPRHPTVPATAARTTARATASRRAATASGIGRRRRNNVRRDDAAAWRRGPRFSRPGRPAFRPGPVRPGPGRRPARQDSADRVAAVTTTTAAAAAATGTGSATATGGVASAAPRPSR